ncbi:MAG TPA: GNAT family protein [Streptosporangiaceae bacterium]|nr:GNAT family protein [Streptosporangiaceae bacterium]
MTDADAQPLEVGERVFLRPITAADEAEFTRLVRESARLHHPWMELPDNPGDFRDYVARFEPPADKIGLNVCARDTGALVGGVNMNNVVHGRFQNSALGYWAFANGVGRGYLTEGLRLVIRYAFGELGLHRLEANIQPGNEASIRLVKRNGFRYEGTSPDYLFINGAWRDHERWALTTEMVDPGEG